MKFKKMTNELYGAKNAGYVIDVDAPRITDADLYVKLAIERGNRFVDGKLDALYDFDGDLYKGEDGEYYAVEFVNTDDEVKPFCWQRVIKTKKKDDRTVLYDSWSGMILGRILTDGMTVDEMLDFLGYSISDNVEGQLIDSNGEYVNAYYDNLETCYADIWTDDRFIAKPEFTDRVYGSETPTAISMNEIKRLADEWGMAFGDLMEQFEEI